VRVCFSPPNKYRITMETVLHFDLATSE
jgi:hypothetical protein